MVASGIPTHTQKLGSKLIAFVLNTTEDRVNGVIGGTASLDSCENQVVETLEATLFQVVNQGVNDGIFESQDLTRLLTINTLDGQNPLTALRQSICPVTPYTRADDDVEVALAKLCEECFPFTLLPRDIWDIGIIRPMLPFLLHSDALSAFVEAVMKDKTLLRLFPDDHIDRYTTSRTVYTSFGAGASFQLCFLHRNLISAAIGVTQVSGKLELLDLQDAAIEMLRNLRKIARGEAVKLPVVEIFDLCGVSHERKALKSGWSFSGIPRDFLKVLRPEARPYFVSDDKILGCMSIRDVDFSVFVAPAGAQQQTDAKWPVADNLLGDHHILVSAATGLALDRDDATAARRRATITFDPICGIGQTWSTINATIADHHFCTSTEREKIEELLEKLTAEKLDKIRIAIRRYVTSIVARYDAEDSLIDAVIGLENLFGARAEIAQSVSFGTSHLLGTGAKERKTIFDDVKRIYNYRSQIVHGTSPSGKEVFDMRSKAVSYLRRCILSLIDGRQDLLQVKGAERVRELVLEDKNQRRPSQA